MLDKNNIISKISRDEPVEIEIGCGDRKRDPDVIGIDILDTSATDIVGDALEVLRALPGESVKSISSYHVFEHLQDIQEIIAEVERLLVPGGEMLVVVPHYSNPFYYSDPTHRNFFGLYTFSYFCEDKLFRRRVPSYVRRMGLELSRVRLVFKSFPPRYLTHALRKVFQSLFNISNWSQEIYEDSFSSFISCYEIHYTIRKT